MKPHLQLRPALTAASLDRRQSPQHFLRLLEAHLSALIDAKDTPDWTINPAYHPDVNEFIQTFAHNSVFLQRARSLQQNRAQYFVKVRAQTQRPPARPTVLSAGRATVVQATPVPMGILVGVPVAVPAQTLPVAKVIG